VLTSEVQEETVESIIYLMFTDSRLGLEYKRELRVLKAEYVAEMLERIISREIDRDLGSFVHSKGSKGSKEELIESGW
jgi:hypothetical protein